MYGVVDEGRTLVTPDGHVDVVELAREVLDAAGIAVFEHAPGELLQPELNLVFAPVAVDVTATPTGIQTVAWTPVWGGSTWHQGTASYLHGAAATVLEALRASFVQWATLELPVVLDAERAQPRDSLVLAHAASRQRVLLGPVEWVGQEQVGEHPGACACCLFTHARDALAPVLRDTRTHGVLLYARRDPDGSAHASVRVDGDSHPAAEAALVAWVRRWRGHGRATHRQYLVTQRDPVSSGPGTVEPG